MFSAWKESSQFDPTGRDINITIGINEGDEGSEGDSDEDNGDKLCETAINIFGLHVPARVLDFVGKGIYARKR